MNTEFFESVNSRKCLTDEQRTDVMQKVEHFRNKKFLIVHGTADGNVDVPSHIVVQYLRIKAANI